MKFSLFPVIFLMMTIVRFISGKQIPKIGIIGGGIGGTSCAFFLKSLFGEGRVSIDMFEAEKIGGRVAVAEFSGELYEEGGCIIHSRNRYMVEFLEKFKLKKRKTPDSYLAIYDGRDFVFSESNWKVKTLYNALSRYGFDLLKLKSYIDGMLTKFENIYELQSKGVTYNTVGEMLAAMDPEFVNYLTTTTESGFQKQGMSKLLIDEIIMATIRTNYGQNLKIQKMVGSVSVAGAIGELWAVHGGNVKIPEKLLAESKANLINDVVTSVKNTSSGKILITIKSEEFDNFSRLYDVVIVATPQTNDSSFKIKFENFNEEINFWGKYHRTVSTFVEGSLSESFFPKKEPYINEILTVNEKISFNSIGEVSPVNYDPDNPNNCLRPSVWKVFTQKKMGPGQISSLFSGVKKSHAREWLAYPHYDSTFRNDSFVLAPNLYHINAIEWAASAMEMSVIGAKNAALLAYDYLKPTLDESWKILINTKKQRDENEKEL